MEETSMERQQEIQRHTEGELPEGKIFDLLSSIGNGENKALELIAMKRGVTYSSYALYQEVMDHQVKNGGWKMHHTTPFGHCRDSLSPIGLVTKEALRPNDSAWGYEITEYGIKTGVPFAGLLLKWSYEHPDHSLHKMFGAANSSSIKEEQTLEKKRAQETRYKIFWEIATNPSNRIRLKDIADAINEESVFTSRHIESLSRNGIISYETTDKGKSYSYFRLKGSVVSDEIKQYRHEKILSDNIYSLLTQEYLSVEEIADSLVKQYPEPEYENLNKKYISGRVARVLSYFEKQGYVERKKFGHGFHSEITLSDEQKKIIVDFVNLIDKFKNGDRETIDEGRRFAQRVVNDPNLFSELMLKAKEASPRANMTSKDDLQSHIVSILQDHPDSTVNQITQRLEEEYDKKILKISVSRFLRNLSKKGGIAFKETKSGNVYQVVDPNDQAVII